MRTLFFVIVLLVAPLVSFGVAQNPLEEAKSQYAAAAYEDALSTLTRAGVPGGSRVEVEQYRAFCLIALGRMEDAERAVAALVEADPQYAPSPSVASPRVLSLVSEMRAKELPGVARRLLDRGRTAFQEKNFARAQEDLNLLLELLEDEALKGREESQDLRVLAEGFVTLAAARAVAAAPPAPESALPAAPAAAPAAETAETMTPPVPVKQDAPAWVPPNQIAGAREYSGSIRVRIGADGRVISATIEEPTYPSYDARLLQASRDWVYKPATRNGVPVESERVIPVQLRPRQ